MASNTLNSGFEILHLHTFTDTEFKLSSRKKVLRECSRVRSEVHF